MMLLLLAATAMAVLLAGCGSSHGSSQREVGSSQQTSEPTTNETLVGRCADNGSTVRQQEVHHGEVSNGRIAFARITEGAMTAYSKGIYVIDEEGAHETRLPQNTQFEANPVWSPDGQKIAIGTLRELSLYVMNADGTNQTQLAENVSPGTIPTWSPDGGKIAFTRIGSYARRTDLYVINADGTNEARLNTSISGRYELGNPVWSPAGNKIAFAGLSLPDTSASSSAEAASAPAERLSGIYLINMDGTGLCKLTSTAGELILQFGYPVWSPGGEKIAFSDVGTLNVINADGSGRKQLTSSTYGPGPGQYAWSPDGKRIAFSDVGTLNVINADGSGLRYLTNTAGPSSLALPTWSPDSEKIAFSCTFKATVDAHTDLCVINADGTGLKRIASNVAPDEYRLAASWGRE
jgi:TolB protein